MTTEKTRKRKLRKPRTITLPPATYQPPKAEQEKGHDMPGASLKAVRRAFFRPLNVQRKPAD